MEQTLSRLENVGKQLLAALDEIEKIACPECGSPDLRAAPVYSHISIRCQGPVLATDQYGNEDMVQCPFIHLVHSTRTVDMPKFTTRRSRKGPKGGARPMKEDTTPNG